VKLLRDAETGRSRNAAFILFKKATDCVIVLTQKHFWMKKQLATAEAYNSKKGKFSVVSYNFLFF
jgi:hypothetical protein